MPRLHALLLTAFAALSLAAQTHVTPYRLGLTAEGLTYFLPQTRLQITLTATRRHCTPGEYARYAELYLREHDAVLTETDEWTLTDVEITPYAVANTAQAFTVRLKSGSLAPLCTLTPDGRLVSINALTPASEYAAPDLAVPSVRQTLAPDLSGQKAKTTEMLAATSTAKMAQIAAQEIYDIRENRDLLMKGQADFMPKDGEQLRLMLARLDQQEKALLTLFHGTVEEEEHVFTLDVTPTRAVTDSIVARFSRHLGLVEADDPAGEPLFFTLTPSEAPRAATEEEIAAATKGKAPKEVLDVRYVVPLAADIQLTATPETSSPTAQRVGGRLLLATLRTPIAALGRIEHLGGELFTKKSPTAVHFDPLTGGIRSIQQLATE